MFGSFHLRCNSSNGYVCLELLSFFYRTRLYFDSMCDTFCMIFIATFVTYLLSAQMCIKLMYIDLRPHFRLNFPKIVTGAKAT